MRPPCPRRMLGAGPGRPGAAEPNAPRTTNTRSPPMIHPRTTNRRARAIALLLGLALALGLLPFAPRPAAAAGATFVVDRTTDQPDPNLGDARCDVAPAIDGD